MAIPEVTSAGEIFKKYQECLNIFCPNTHHCTTSPLALCEGLCPTWTTWNTSEFVKCALRLGQLTITTCKLIITERNPPWEGNSSIAIQEIPWAFQNPQVLHYVHKDPHWPLSWTKLIQSIFSQPVSLKIHFNIIILVMLTSSKDGLLVMFPGHNFVCLSHL